MNDKKIISNQRQDEAGKMLYVQNKQINKINQTVSQQNETLNQLESLNKENNENLDYLLMEAKKLLQGESITQITTKDEVTIVPPNMSPIEIIPFNNETTWDEFLNAVYTYTENNQINLNVYPFEELLSDNERRIISERILEDYTMQDANCDKYDYAIAAFSGVISGVIDSFFVGMPRQSKLGNWTDKQIDSVVIQFAERVTGNKYNQSKIRKIGGQEVEVEPIALAIEGLENIFRIHYDQPTGKAAGSVFNMSASNHHMKSLGHAPSPVGLIFSVLDQIKETSHFVDNGRLITHSVPGDKIIAIKGNNLIENIFYGIVNWFGHILSDVAGSSGTRAEDSSRRGMGVPIPGFELLQFIGKKYDDKKDIKEQRKSIADFSVSMFEKGYDFRFGAAQSIPVALNEVLIRFLWGLKRKYYHDLDWEDCVPFGGNKPELRRVLVTGHGVLCLVDLVDAGIRSNTIDKVNPDTLKNSTALNFALRLNYVGWNRLALAGLIEVRAIYQKNTIDLTTLEDDLEKEWEKLYNNHHLKN